MFRPHLPVTSRARTAPAALAAVLAISVAALVACGGDDGAADAPVASDAAAAADAPGIDDAAAGDVGPAVRFVAPASGATIAGPVEVEFAATNLTVEPAGDVHAGAGHLHVIADRGCVTEGTPIPKDAQHVHFGGGQLQGTVYLAAGTHVLCLQVGDGTHVAQPITQEITVTVGVRSLEEWCRVAGQWEALVGGVSGSADLAEAHAAYTGGQALADQLINGIGYTDAAHQAAVDAHLGYFQRVAGDVLAADDIDEVAGVLAGIGAGAPPESEAARDYMTAACGAG
jgi:hypothetical protein